MIALEIDAYHRIHADPEPKPVVAGVLAIAVHTVFAVVLFLNMTWQHKAQQHASVKLWDSLPVTRAEAPNRDRPKSKPPESNRREPKRPEPQVQPPPEPQFTPSPQRVAQLVPLEPVAALDVPSPPAPQPAVVAPAVPVAAPAMTPSAADLAAPTREKPDQRPPTPISPTTVKPPGQVSPVQFEQQEVTKPTIDVEKLKRERALALAELLREEEQARLDQSINSERDKRISEHKKRLAQRERKLEQGLEEIRTAAQARQKEESERAEQEAAAQAITDDYRARISAKIRQRVILPQELVGNPEAIYEVSLLPSGDVTNVRLLRTSGFTTYDAAVERAILAAQPLPVPTDSGLFQANFKTLLLNFRPEE